MPKAAGKAKAKSPKKGGERKKKAKKDPNAPKRALSAFFCFCNEERAKVKAKNPALGIGDVAKELGKRWETCANKSKYEALAAKDKERYNRELAAYKKTGGGGSKPSAKKGKAAAHDDDDDDDDDDDE